MKSVNGIGGIHLPSGKHVLGMKKARHIFGTAKVGDRGQIVIPKDARELYGIHPGDTLLILAALAAKHAYTAFQLGYPATDAELFE